MARTPNNQTVPLFQRVLLADKKRSRCKFATFSLYFIACAANSCAKLCHRLGGRTLLTSFPNSVRPPPPGSESDFHFAIKSKLHRIVSIQNDLPRDLKHCAVSFISTPMDHLMQVLQKPMEGGTLIAMVSNQNPFHTCQKDLGDSLLHIIVKKAVVLYMGP